MIRSLLVIITLILFFVIALPLLGILWIIRKYNHLLSNTIAQAILRSMCRIILAISGTKISIEGFENIPKDQAVLFVGNHTSYFDIVATLAQKTGLCGYVAKFELKRIPSLRIWMKRIDCVFLDRENIRAAMAVIKSAMDNIKNGISVFIFPEGTRYHDTYVHEFKAGSFKIATKTGCPIVPVSIKGGDNIFENHVPFIKPTNVHIKYGTPVYPENLSPEEKKNISVYIHDIVENMLLS